MLHDLKIAPEWFETVKSGVKTFEVRKDDRDFKPNDVLVLREFDGIKYTGRQLKADVRFVLRNEYCREGYCIMSIVPNDIANNMADNKAQKKLIAEYKRLLKAAVEDLAKIPCNNDVYIPSSCDACIKQGNCDYSDSFKWRYADEALKLIGGSENE